MQVKRYVAKKLTYKIKSHPRTGHEGPEGEYRYNCTLSLASTLHGVSGQGHAPAALPPLGSVSPGTGLKIYDIFVNCNWVVTRWQKYSTHLHTNNTQNDTKQTIHRTTQQFWKSAGRAPSWLVIPWHLPYN